MKSSLFQHTRTALLTAAVATALTLPLMAGDGKDVKPVVEPEETHVHFLFQVEFGSAYTTPRGMMVRNEGLTIQPLFLTFIDLYKGDGFLNSVKLVGGVWNDFGTSPVSEHPPYGSNPRTNWTEIDPIAGLSFGILKNFTLDVTYTAFCEQILDIGTSHHLETKLSFNDSDLLGAFALHPYVLYWQELDGKATDADVPQAVFGPSSKSGSHPSPASSFYFEVGIDPSYTFKSFHDLKIEAPCRVLLPDERFYGEYYGSSSFLGLAEAGLKASMPLNMPKGYGHWSVYAGARYQYYNDKNLYHLNAFNTTGDATRDSWGFYGGFSVFF